MTDIKRTDVVQRGDCPWKVAERNLRNKGQKITNAQIVQEMNRLAKLNGCDDAQDFGQKFFMSIGNEFLVDEEKNKSVSQKTTNAPKSGDKPQPTVTQKTTVNQQNKPKSTNAPKSGGKPQPTVTQKTTVNQQNKPKATVTKKTTVAPKPAVAPKQPKSPVTPKQTSAPKTNVKTQQKISLKAPNATVKTDTTQKINAPEDTIVSKTTVAPKAPEQVYADKINAMQNDEQRIIEHNKTNYQGEYYGIVDKKSCQLKIYDKKGNVVKTFIVGVGKSIGDGLGKYYQDHFEKNSDAWKAESNRFTTAGEYTLDEVKKTADAYTGKDGKPKIMQLKGDSRGIRSGQIGLHMLYKPQYAKREAAINSPGLADNRMSYGCVNLKEEEWDEMHKYLGEGDKLYVLPEEKGNKLQLEKQKDGSYKFEQIYHRNDVRELSKEEASQVNYDIRPDKNPINIAKKEAAKKAAESKQIAQTKTENIEHNKKFYDPRTWFS